MEPSAPLVSVSMITYNAEAFLAEAIEGVLRQEMDFPLELVIGDDASPDNTRKIAEQYAEQYPDIIRVLPAGPNLGIAGNTSRTMKSCKGKYIAICDGDDVWQDPQKLKKQVQFLETHPDYGISYTDVTLIDEKGDEYQDAEYDEVRQDYTDGYVFFKLLMGNFINNSSAVYRSSFLEDYEFDPDRSYHIQDHFLWLHITAHAKVHFLPAKTTLYRQHSGALTNPDKVAKRMVLNKKKYHHNLFKAILEFDGDHLQEPGREEKEILFKKILSLLSHWDGTPMEKIRVLRILPKYTPPFSAVVRILSHKLKTILFPNFGKKMTPASNQN